MQNTIHPRDLIVGLQKGLALIQLFSKTCPKLTVAQTAKIDRKSVVEGKSVLESV